MFLYGVTSVKITVPLASLASIRISELFLRLYNSLGKSLYDILK